MLANIVERFGHFCIFLSTISFTVVVFRSDFDTRFLRFFVENTNKKSSVKKTLQHLRDLLKIGCTYAHYARKSSCKSIFMKLEIQSY